VDALADAPTGKIIECIKECGIHKKRAVFLKDGLKIIRDKHNGMIPQTFDEFMALPGVGHQTATLLLNEGFDFFAGIGTDKLVCNMASALGLFSRTFGLKNAAANHMEDSLHCWISQPHFKETNRIFGGMAQLVTQQLNNPKSKNWCLEVNLMAGAIADWFKNNDYELELIWHIIGKLREHYKGVVEKRLEAKEKDEEESGDEAEEDDEEEAEMERQKGKLAAAN
jgi:endonuclease III